MFSPRKSPPKSTLNSPLAASPGDQALRLGTRFPGENLRYPRKRTARFTEKRLFERRNLFCVELCTFFGQCHCVIVSKCHSVIVS